MYKVLFLPSARRDMIEIIRYLSEDLDNPGYADKLATEMIEAAEAAAKMPYKNHLYLPIRPLKHEYRSIPVRSYLTFYWVDEDSGTVTFARVIYGRRDISRLLP